MPRPDYEIVRQYEADLKDGTVAYRHARSAGSIIGYQPPTNHQAVAHFYKTVGRMMAESSAMCAIGESAAYARPSVAFTGGQNTAKVYDRLAVEIKHGFFDTVGKASPEPGRASDHERPYTLTEVVRAHQWLAEAVSKFSANNDTTIGWAMQALIDRDEIRMGMFT